MGRRRPGWKKVDREMFRKWMLAGLMAATCMGGIAPVHAQNMDRGRQDRARAEVRSPGIRGNDMQRQAHRPDRQRSQQRATARPQTPNRADGQWRAQRQAATPPAARNWRESNARPTNRQLRPDVRQERRPDRRPDARVERRQTPTPSTARNWRDDRRDNRPDRRNDARSDRRDWQQDRQADRRASQRVVHRDSRWNDGRRYDDRTRWASQRRWDNGWRQDRRYDWRSYRNHYGDRYRIGRYAAPRGWDYGYRRFSTGIVLSSLLYSRNYWLDDPYSYRLPPAYGTLRWVRYYDDALLVDIRDGYVVDVIHDFFW